MKKKVSQLSLMWQKIIINNNIGKITVSKMQMTTPYYPGSVLSQSKFHGFYTLFYMFTMYFSIVFPALNYIKTGTFFQKAYFKIIQTNFMWDVIALTVFLFMSLLLMSLTKITKVLCQKLTNKQVTILFIALVGFLWTSYIGIGFYIVRTYPMYFTDKIFIVVMSWVYFIKTSSYIFDIHQIIQISSKFQVQRKETGILQKSIDKQQDQGPQQLILLKKSSNLLQSPSQVLKTNIIFLLSPQIIFKHFILNYNPLLRIHPVYIINKILVCVVCSLVNLILMIQMIQPLCSAQNLSHTHIIQLFFRFIPPIFYVNICLYFMILQNILPAIAQATRMKDRRYYLEWWNAKTIYQFLDCWVLVINVFMKEYLGLIWINNRLRHTVHVAVVMFLIFQIFSVTQRPFAMLPFLVLAFVILVMTFFLGGIQPIQNNYLVHIIIFSFSPLMLAIEMKYKVFSGQN